MFLFKKIKNKVWHISTNEIFSICRNDSVYKRGGADSGEPDKDYVEVLYDKSEITSDIKDSLCKPCLMKAYEEGLIRVEFSDKLMLKNNNDV